MRRLVISYHLTFGYGAIVPYRLYDAVESQVLVHSPVVGCLREEGSTRAPDGPGVSPEHGPVERGLRRGYGAIGVSHQRPVDHPPFDDHFWLHPKAADGPQDDVGQLPWSDGPDQVGYAVSNGGIDGQLG